MKKTILTFGLSAVMSYSAFAGPDIEVPAKIEFAGEYYRTDAKVRERIRKKVDALTENEHFYEEVIKLADLYFPVIEHVLLKERIPEDFKYLVLQESRLRSEAVSSSNAVGYWQFKEPTAKEMKLRVDGSVDERKNIVAATRAAAKYLYKNNQTFKSWIYSLLSYNVGLNGTFEYDRYGKKRFSNRLDEGTHDYIVTFMAHMIAYENCMEHCAKHNLALVPYETQGGKLFDIARNYDLKYEELAHFNRWLKGDVVPSDKVYTVLLPIDKNREKELKRTLELERRPTPQNNMIGQIRDLNSKRLSFVTDTTLVRVVSKDYPKIENVTQNKKNDKTYIKAKVNGLSALIATRHLNFKDMADYAGLSLSEFKDLNDLDRYALPVPAYPYYIEEKKKVGTKATHALLSGESLWLVSQRFGIQMKTLRKFNGLSGNATPRSGTVLYLQTKRPKNIEPEVREPQALPLSPMGIVLSEEDLDLKDGWLSPDEELETGSETDAAETDAETDLSPTKTDETAPESDGVIDLNEATDERTADDDSEDGSIDDDIFSEEETNPKEEGLPTVAVVDTSFVKDPAYVYHQAADDETLYNLSEIYGVSTDQLREINTKLPESDYDYLGEGKFVAIRKRDKNEEDFKYHTVSAGESLYSIAKAYKITITEIKEWNNITSLSSVEPGRQLIIREADTYSPSEKTDSNEDSDTKVYQYYTVDEGGTSLFELGNKFNVPIENLQSWNNLGSELNVTGGTRLIVGISDNKIPSDEVNIDDKAFEGYPDLSDIGEDDPLPTIEEITAVPDYHTVEQGETWSSIARKYHIPREDLMKWNEEATAGMLGVGSDVQLKADKDLSSVKNAETEADQQNESEESVSRTDAEYLYHTVVSGETLYSLSVKYNVSTADIKKWNGLSSNSIKSDTDLIVGRKMPEWRYYVIQSGETLYSIAVDLGIQISDIKEWNKLSSDDIGHNQRLKILSSAVSPDLDFDKQDANAGFDDSSEVSSFDDNTAEASEEISFDESGTGTDTSPADSTNNSETGNSSAEGTEDSASSETGSSEDTSSDKSFDEEFNTGDSENADSVNSDNEETEVPGAEGSSADSAGGAADVYVVKESGQPITLRLLSATLNIDTETLKKLNPFLAEYEFADIPVGTKIKTSKGSLPAGSGDAASTTPDSTTENTSEDTPNEVTEDESNPTDETASIEETSGDSGTEGESTTPGETFPDNVPGPEDGATPTIEDLTTRPETYKVQIGDGLFAIAKKFNISFSDLKAWNNIEDPRSIKPGDVINLYPPKENISENTQETAAEETVQNFDGNEGDAMASVEGYREHIVKDGETLSGIAGTYKVSTDQIKKLNDLADKPLEVGQTLIISADTDEDENPEFTEETESESGSSIPAPDAAGVNYHIVQEGETSLYSIQYRYKDRGFSLADLRKWNSLAEGEDYLQPGTKVLITNPQTLSGDTQNPSASFQVNEGTVGESDESGTAFENYTVQSGDTLYSISVAHGVSTSELKSWNERKGDIVYPGETLKIKKK